MEQTNAEIESTLCRNCHRFYGSQATQFLCSSCFKKNHSSPLPSPTLPSSPPQHIDSPAPLQLEKPAEDPSRCFNCRRKVGLLGHKCRCEHTFCKVHRLPEEHQCQFDYARSGKARLEKQNPLVKYKKLQEI